MKLTITHDDVLQAISNFVSGQMPLDKDVKVEPEHIRLLVRIDHPDNPGPGYECQGAEIDLDF